MEEREIALVETKKVHKLIAINHAHFSSRFAGFFFKSSCMDRVKGHNFFLSFDSFYFSSREAFVLLIL